MDSTVAYAILGVELLLLVGLVLHMRAYFKWLEREDLRRDWRWASLVYRLRDALREARGDDDSSSKP